MQEKWDGLLFDVRRSVRYHQRRRRFFERWHIVTNAISVIGGSAALASISGAHPTLGGVAASVITIVGAFDLVVGTSQKSWAHADLARRFVEIEREMFTIQTPSEADYTRMIVRRLTVEADEPPVLRVLDAICYNEMMTATGFSEGSPQRFTITRLQRWLANFFSYNEAAVLH